MTQHYCAMKTDDTENLGTNCGDLHSSPCKELPPFLTPARLQTVLIPLLGESLHFSLSLMDVVLCSGEWMFVPASLPMEISSGSLGMER